MSRESGSFFRQSAWLSASTLVSGGLMSAVQTVANRLPENDFVVFGSMIRVFPLLGMPTTGVQTVFAQQTATAHTAEAERTLAGTVRGVLLVILAFWLCLLAGALIWTDRWVTAFGLQSSAPLWPTLGMSLTWLVLPVFRGVLQGHQNFAALGWVAMLDAAGRFGAIAVIVLHWQGHATAALDGALFGQLLSIAVAVWSTRKTWLGPGGPVQWGPWIKKVIPLTFAMSGMLILAGFDYSYLVSVIPKGQSEVFQVGRLYYPAMMIGFALTQLTVPLALVMFPKIARSSATGQKSDALFQALVGTATMGVLAGIATVLFPELPLRILYFNNSKYWAAAPLVPWMVWAMLSYTLANVLVSHLVARGRLDVVPWVVGSAALYVVCFWQMTPWLLSHPPEVAYRWVVTLVGSANLLLFLIALIITRRKVKSPTVSLR